MRPEVCSKCGAIGVPGGLIPIFRNAKVVGFECFYTDPCNQRQQAKYVHRP